MKLLFRISLISLVLLPGAHITLACTCVHTSLAGRFREAKAIFIGRLIDEESQDKSLIQNYSDNKFAQTLEVIRGFKGTKKRFIKVIFDVEGLKSGGMCPTFYHFEPNREYLVFAYKNYEVRMVCSDTREIPADKEAGNYEWAQEDIKKLGSFWFRFRARLNPF